MTRTYFEVKEYCRGCEVVSFDRSVYQKNKGVCESGKGRISETTVRRGRSYEKFIKKFPS